MSRGLDDRADRGIAVLALALLAMAWMRVLAEIPSPTSSAHYSKALTPGWAGLVTAARAATVPNVLFAIGAALIVLRPHRALAWAYAVSAGLDALVIALGFVALYAGPSDDLLWRQGWALLSAALLAAAAAFVAWRATRYDSSEPDLNR